MMASKLVLDYHAEWKISNDSGKLKLRFQGSNRYVAVPLTSYQEYLALLTLLQGPKGVYYNNDTNTFGTMN